MSRELLPEDRVHPGVRGTIAGYHRELIAEVQAAIEAHDLVVVGMAQNPHVKKARDALKSRGLPFHYLEYGSYLSGWRKRLALKMWSGWPTFPMVFHRGTFVGGAADLIALLEKGEVG